MQCVLMDTIIYSMKETESTCVHMYMYTCTSQLSEHVGTKEVSICEMCKAFR